MNRMRPVEVALVLLLLLCAAVMSLTKRSLTAVISYAIYGLVMTLIWLFLQAPDLAITEAAVGVGATGILFFVVINRSGGGKGREGSEED